MLHRKGVFKALLVLLLLVGVTGLSVESQADPSVGEEMKVIELYWAKRDVKEILSRLGMVTQAITGREIKGKVLENLLRDPAAWNHWITPFEDSPEFKVKIDSDYDEIRAVNLKLSDIDDGIDVGEKQAVKSAREYLAKLRDQRAVDGLDYSMDDVQVGYTRVGGGSMDGKESFDHVSEYRVTFRPNINGIQLANAGVRIALHRSGALSGIRLGGVSVNVEKGKTVVRKVRNEQIEERFKKMIPDKMKAVVAWSRVMYAIPDGKRQSIVQPLKLYSYSLVAESDVERVVSRRKVLGFSLTDERAEVIDFTPSAKEHQGLELERKNILKSD